jgi:pimeloyl-ACP methyl ester carboxylesterase
MYVCVVAMAIAGQSSARPPARAAQDEAMPNLKTAKVNGIELAYTEAGAGEPVVLVHGSLVDYRYSLPLMRELSRRYRVINYSRRCHAPNPCPRGAAYSHQLQADDLAALIRELKLGPAHIVGHSYGAAVAVYMAQKHPELVRSLTLIEPGLYALMPTHERAMQARQEMAAAGERARDALAHDLDEEAVRQLAELVLRPRRYASLPADMRAMLLENAPSLRASIAAAAPPQFTCDEAKRLRMPVLLLGGENSAPEFRLVNDELQRCIRQARRVTISPADHNLVYDLPQPVAEAVLEFLAAAQEAGSR